MRDSQGGYASEFNITVGDAYVANDKQELALEHYVTALEVAVKAQYQEGQIFSHARIGEAKMKMGRHDEAREHLETARIIAHDAGNHSEEQKCIDLLARLPQELE